MFYGYIVLHFLPSNTIFPRYTPNLAPEINTKCLTSSVLMNNFLQTCNTKVLQSKHLRQLQCFRSWGKLNIVNLPIVDIACCNNKLTGVGGIRNNFLFPPIFKCNSPGRGRESKLSLPPSSLEGRTIFTLF